MKRAALVVLLVLCTMAASAQWRRYPGDGATTFMTDTMTAGGLVTFWASNYGGPWTLYIRSMNPLEPEKVAPDGSCTILCWVDGDRYELHCIRNGNGIRIMQMNKVLERWAQGHNVMFYLLDETRQSVYIDFSTAGIRDILAAMRQ